MITELAEPPTHAPQFLEMDTQLRKDLVQVFKLLADDNRLKILIHLAREQELNVSSICDRLGQSQPAVSHHLALMRVAGLIECRRDGKHNFYSIRKAHFRDLIEELFHTVATNGDRAIHIDDFVIRHGD